MSQVSRKMLPADRGICGDKDSLVCPPSHEDVLAEPKSDFLKKVEASFRERRRTQPEDVDEARELARKVLEAVPGYENLRMRTLADVIGASQELTRDRVYNAIATAADGFGVWPSTLVAQIVRTKTTVGTLMTQSGKR